MNGLTSVITVWRQHTSRYVVNILFRMAWSYMNGGSGARHRRDVVLGSGDAVRSRDRAGRRWCSRVPRPPVVDLVAKRVPRLRVRAQPLRLPLGRPHDAATPLTPRRNGVTATR